MKFCTYTFGNFIYYREEWYPNGTKHIPSNIEELLTDEALAYLVMDDGTLKAGNAVSIATYAFEKKELELFRKAITNKFGVEAFVRKHAQYWRILIPASSARR